MQEINISKTESSLLIFAGFNRNKLTKLTQTILLLIDLDKDMGNIKALAMNMRSYIQ